MTFDTQNLRVFVALARHLNMSRAAEEVGLTPSAVSHCLKSLEADLGCLLCERTSRKLILTQPGELLRREAEAILGQMESAQSRLREWRNWRKGLLRIGADAGVCQLLLPAALREFRESFPEFTVQIEVCSADQAIERILEDRLDLGVSIQPDSHPGIECISLGHDELHFVVNPMHRWALKGKVVRDEIRDQRFILPVRDSDARRVVENYFRQEGIRLRPFIEVANDAISKQFVLLDLGIALLPKWLVSSEVEAASLKYFPLGRRRLQRRWGILHALSRKPEFAESIFIDLCRNVCESGMLGR